MKLPDPQHYPKSEDLLTAIGDYINNAHASLAENNIDELAGLDTVVDTLCARIIAMTADEGRAFEPKLNALRDRLDQLQQDMTATKQAMEKELHELNARQRASRAYRKDD